MHSKTSALGVKKEYTFEDYKKKAFTENPELKEMYDQEMLNFFIWSEIRKIRTKKWISQQDLASKIHTTHSVIARIASGKSNISMKTLWRLASWLGAKIELVA